jgi:quinol-cytochrome oxidoreductase complex cytochrome b subunit
VPSTEQAYDRMLDLRGSVAFGTFLRNMHRWAAHGMVAAVFLHMCRVFFTGSYKKPREFNWVIGVMLFLLTLFSSFTGYLLPWDQLAFWAITVGAAIAGYAPVMGKEIQFLLLGDYVVGQEALLRFYVLHVVVLPVIMTVIIAVHFWRIRKDGGLSRPPEAPGASATAAELKPLPATPSKTFGLMGFVRHPSAHAGNVPDNTVHSWPYLFVAELLVLVLTIAGVLVLAFFFDAPLEEPVNVMHPPNPAKAPWYFLGLQELVSYDAFWGGVGIPTLAVIVLMLIPYIDRKTGGVGRWFARERLLANTLFLTFAIVNIVLIVIGTFFRGPNWAFVSPW